MDRLPETLDLRKLHLEPAEITRVQTIHSKHGARLYRIECGDRSFVLKYFGDAARAAEVRCYALLEQCAVPTLPVHGRTEQALLLEDLDRSQTWRLASAEDMQSGPTGAAIARWYLALHAGGRKFLAEAPRPPSFLRREADALTPATVLETGRRLGLGDRAVWQLAADTIEPLKRGLRSLPETFTYNDFFPGNLALSRGRDPSLRAIVFDYHLLGIGPAFADCRNVVGSLGPEAEAAFWQTYGLADEREAVLDAPASVLFALGEAARRPRLPSWANGLIAQVTNGQLERSLGRAIQALRELRA